MAKLAANPELRRNIWLELTGTRLLIAPLVLFLIYGSISLSRPANLPLVNLQTSLTLILLILGLWGSRLTLGAIVEEVRDRTWDLQRMSSLGAWTLTWGKLLGAAIFSWYAAAFVFLVFIQAGVQIYGPINTIKFTLSLLCSALMLHALCLAASLTMVHRAQLPGRALGIILFIFPLIIINGVSAGLASQVSQETSVTWWNIDFASFDFVLGSVVAFLAWALLGAYRLMRRELQYRSMPWAWPGFLLFLILYINGFPFEPFRAGSSARTPAEVQFLVGCVIMLAGTYYMIVSEPKDVVQLRKLQTCLRAADWRRAATVTPGWLAALLSAIGWILFSTLYFAPGSRLATFALSALLFLVRDISLFLFLNLGRNPRRRADTAAIFYLALLYTIVPFFLISLSRPHVGLYFFPTPDIDDSSDVIIAHVLQALIAVGLVVRRWRQRIRELN